MTGGWFLECNSDGSTLRYLDYPARHDKGAGLLRHDGRPEACAASLVQGK